MKTFCTMAFKNMKWDIQIASDKFGTLRINFDKDLATKERERERHGERVETPLVKLIAWLTV